MKDPDLQLGEALNSLIEGSKRGVILVNGNVSEIDDTNYTCTVTVGESQFYQVPLKILIGSRPSIIGIPKDGTDCLMTFRDGNIQRPQLFSAHEYDKLFVTCDDIEINGLSLKYNNLNITEMLNVITGTPINEPGNGSPSAFQQALSTALNT